MAVLSSVQTFWAADVAAIGETAQMVLTWRAGAGADVPVLTIHNAYAGLATSVELLRAAPMSLAGLATLTVGGPASNTTLDLDGAVRGIGLLPLEGLAADPASQTLWLDRSALAGNAVTACRDGALLFVSARYGSGISSYRMEAEGRAIRLSALTDSDELALEAISAMTSLHRAEGHYLVVASETRDTLSLLRVEPDGLLGMRATIGPESLLPVDCPSQLVAATLGNQSFVVAGSTGTGSLTVLRLDSGGTLTCVDHVLDSRDSRFGGLTALSLLQRGDQILVAAAGNDGGISLFQLLPTGRLLLRDTLIDDPGTALQGIRQLRLVEVDGRVELFALSTTDRGVTRIVVDVARLAGGPQGVVASVADGTVGNDILTAPAAGGNLRAGAGDDILISSAGRDRLDGGTGSDIFVLMPDALGRDAILDFDPATDRLDLSAFPRLYDAASVRILPTETGARLRIGTTDISVTAGRPLTAEELRGAMLFDTMRLLQEGPAPASILSARGDGPDSFFWAAGPRVYDGGGGVDRISYAAAPTGAVIDLIGQTPNAGSAVGHHLRSIEIVEGSVFADRLAGTASGDTFLGGPSNDLLEGRDGADWLTGGTGNDTLDGGSGTDMASFGDASGGVTVSLVSGIAQSGGDTDVLRSIEGVTGSGFGDLITGNAGANLLRGMEGDDWIVATGGGDTIDGGAGRDMVSYVDSPERVVVDLAAGLGREGMAAGDRYAGIERVTGSIQPDLFFGTTGEDEFRGLGGYDWFVGSDGQDSYDGGTGRDTVAYSAATAGVAASLLAGRGLAGQAAGDRYSQIESLTGSSLADSLTGNTEINVLRGLGGDDLIFGLDGKDTLEGGPGADRLAGGDGNDRLYGGGGNDAIDGGAGWDYAFYTGRRVDYAVSGTATQATVLHANPPVGASDGLDRLAGVEVLVFSDGTLFL